MEAKVYNLEGKEVGKHKLPERLFGVKWNADLVHQVVVSMRANQRQNNASAKGRGEVRGGGKKPWRQKGTGRARHGSIRSPIWRGGGVTHGPTQERSYDQKINRKMKAKALATILSQKLRDRELLLIDELKLGAIKTQEANNALKRIASISGFEKAAYKRGRRSLISLPGADDKAVKSFRNIPSVVVAEARDLDPLTVISYKYLIIADPKKSLAVLEGRLK